MTKSMNDNTQSKISDFETTLFRGPKALFGGQNALFADP